MKKWWIIWAILAAFAFISGLWPIGIIATILAFKQYEKEKTAKKKEESQEDR